MISRFYINCNTCDKHLILRIQMGYSDESILKFNCHRCSEPIEVIMPSEKNEGKIKINGAKFSSVIEETKESGYQYLCADFIADEEKSRDPTYFGAFDLFDSLDLKNKLSKKLKKINADTYQGNTWNPLESALKEWQIIQTARRLERNKLNHLALKKLSELDENDEFHGISSWLSLVNLSKKIFGINNHLMQEIVNINKISQDEFKRMVTDYSYNWRAVFCDAEFEIFSEFFKRWNLFSQTYFYVRDNINLPSNPLATSVNFNDALGCYPLAQEFFSKQIIILTWLNNIKSNRKYNELSKISIEQYIKCDNARRRENFLSNKIFCKISDEYDSQLRNAEAHGWIRVSPDGQSITYKIGGNGKEVKLTFTEYILKCTTLFKQICTLTHIEYILFSEFNKHAKELMTIK